MVIARIHISHLLADFQSIQPMDSNWNDAKRLMQRWHRWGRASDVCNSTDCTYTIAIDDPISYWLSRTSENFQGALGNHGIYSWMGHLGWHPTTFAVQFTMQDGVIVRTRTDLKLSVGPPFFHREDDFGYELILRTRVHPRLTDHDEIENYGWVLGSNGTSTDNPDLKVGRPGGCEICMLGEATYTPQLPHSEIVRISSYDLSCLIALSQRCLRLEDILPAARDWHLYDEPTGPPAIIPRPCVAPAYALARDSDLTFEGEVLSTHSEQQRGPEGNFYSVQSAEVRVGDVLKGALSFHRGDLQTVMPYFHEASWDTYTSETLPVGQHFILFFDEDPSHTIGTVIPLEPCGFVENTPGNLREVQRGVSLDVLTRYGDTYDNKPPRFVGSQ